MKWSILICTLENRKHFLERLLNILLPQIGEYAVECDVYTGAVEIRILRDNKEMAVGEKRNKLIHMAQGEYFSFIDDDISDDYIQTLLTASKDVMTFKTAQYINGVFNKDVIYSTTKGNKNRDDYYIRWANAICCWRTEFARGIRYGN